MIIANVSINVDKIDKRMLHPGEKGRYLDLTIIINDEKDRFDNDVSAFLRQSKEEREARVDRIYFGNGRVAHVAGKHAPGASAPAQGRREDFSAPGPTDDLPF